MPPNPILLDNLETERLLPMKELIPAMGHAFADGNRTPERVIAHDGETDWVIMPGLSNTGLVCKIVSVSPPRKAAGLPTIAGSVFAFDASGALITLADAATLTARRTGAIAGYATDLLANPDAGVLAIFGTGALAEPHVEAVSTVRPLREVRVVGRTSEKSADFADRLRDRGYEARAAGRDEALHGADLIVTVTTSQVPVFSDEFVERGTHVSAMGVYKPEFREVPSATAGRARIAVEDRESAWTEAGDLILAVKEGVIRESDVLADFSEPEKLAGVRSSQDDITLFKSVGHACFDVAAVEILLGSLGVN